MGARHCLVVGGTRGLGRAVAKVLVSSGWTVSVFGRRAPKKRLKLPGVDYRCSNALDPADFRRALKSAVSRHGPLTGLVLSQRYRGAGGGDREELSLGIDAVRSIIEASNPRFSKARPGGIVVIGSAATHQVADSVGVAYHAVKGALLQMLRYYAVTLAPRIRVNGVSPGLILKDEARRFYRRNPKLVRIYRDVVPLERMGEADEVARVVEFLLTPAAAYITGTDIVVDGGASLRWSVSVALQFANAPKKARTHPSTALQ